MLGVRIDLHTHSNRSDGTDAPAALVAKAAAEGLDVVALTDHDTVAGWEEARHAAGRAGIDLLLGAEISCRLQGRSVHLLGYGPDPTNAALAAELDRIRAGRTERVPAILEQLRAHGIALSADDVAAHADHAVAVGRPHIADAMITGGYVVSRMEAFDRWLGEGRPANVPKHAPDVATGIRLVRESGGVPVIAHPRGRGSRVVLTDDRLAELAAAGLDGLEVDHHDHDPATQGALRALARDLDLVVTGSSDYHGAGKVDHPLGSHTTEPREYERLLARIGRQRSTDHTNPEVVPPSDPE